MSELEKLREILFSKEQEALASIKARTESPGPRTRDVAEVLPGAIGLSHRQNPALSKALREPVRESFEYAVNTNPRAFANALFPVIGPAIRKSIAETFKSLIQSLNQTMEYSLSPRGFKWRIEAARAGIPLGEYILRKTLVYRIEQVYLIQRERGLMAGHVQNESAVAQDADAVSAMFTAIQDFVTDSFSPDHSQRLETADIGEFTVWVLHGPHSMMACVIRGVPPRGVRDELAEILERINLQYGDALEKFSGDSDELEGVEQLLEECLLLEQRQDGNEKKSGGLSAPLIILLLVLAAGLGWLLVNDYLEGRRLDAFKQAVADTPGLVATELAVDGRSLSLRGLADPLADDLDAVLQRAGLDAVEVQAELAPYQSLDPSIVLRRAQLLLAPPPGVQLALEGDTLVASGRADARWRQDFLAKAPLLAGVARADASATLQSDAELLRQARNALQPPTGVRLDVTDQVLSISGLANQAWIAALPEKLAALQGLSGANTNALEATEYQQLRELTGQLDGRTFYFESGASLLDDRNTALISTAGQLRRAFALAELTGQRVAATIVGHADGVGGSATNQALMRRRAQALQAGFVAQGLSPEQFSITVAELPLRPVVDARLRKAVLRVQLLDSTAGR